MKVQNKIFRLFKRSVGVALLLLGVNGNALAYCVGDPNATGTILVDATTSCAAISQDGCRIDSGALADGTGCCVIPDSDGTEVCARYAVEGDKFSGVKWNLSGPDNVNWVLTGGATQGGACGSIFDPGVRQLVLEDSPVYGFLKREPDTYQSVTYIDFCTKHETPPAKLRLDKRVVAQDTTAVSPDDYNCANAVKSLDLEISEPVNVKYCYSVTNEGTYPYANVIITDDMGTPGDLTDDMDPIPLGPLGVGEKIEGIKSPEVTFSTPVTIVNTATVGGTDGNDTYVEDDDTATVTTEIVPIACNVLTVEDSNQNPIQDDYLFWYGVSATNPSAPAVCIRTGTVGQYPRSSQNRCIDDCTLKPECINPASGTTGPGGICEQPCLPSGAWTEHDPATAAIPYKCLGPATNVPGNQYPYCWEVQQDLTRNCELNAVHPQVTQETYGEQTSTNPYVYKSCTKQGGRKVCTVYCYLYDGEDEGVCPASSVVIPPS